MDNFTIERGEEGIATSTFRTPSLFDNFESTYVGEVTTTYNPSERINEIIDAELTRRLIDDLAVRTGTYNSVAGSNNTVSINGIDVLKELEENKREIKELKEEIRNMKETLELLLKV